MVLPLGPWIHDPLQYVLKFYGRELMDFKVYSMILALRYMPMVYIARI